MTTTTAPPGGHSSPLGLMSCVRESSPQDLVPQTELMDVERHETKKRRFHPFRGLRKIFRRGASSITNNSGKVRNAGSEETVPVDNYCHEDTSSTKDAHRSRSTSELLASDEATTRRKSGGGSGGSGGMYTGGGNLSVSHDSVFTAEQHSTRGDSTSSDLDTAQSSSSLSIQQLMHQTGVRAELLDVVRRRGRGRGDTSEDEEDLGLPRSPCNSPTTTDKALKEHPTKSHSTCSDGSLLSMGSSEMDEDSFGQHSRHSSKLSLHDRRPTQIPDTDLELGIASLNAPLNHSAARHKMSVRPNRRHGAPRRRRVQQVTTKLAAGSALPTTPEVNEEASTRSLTPEGSATRETIAELYSCSSTSMNKVWTSSAIVPETQLKSASLPPGLALPTGSKLSRSRSNAGKGFAEEDEDTSKEDKKKEESFFGRFLARRSGKKKKSKSEDAEIATKVEALTTITSTSSSTISSSSCTSSYKYSEEKRTFSVDSGISKVARSGPASRQRVQPIDIPSSPDSFRQKRQPNINDLDLPLLPPPLTAASPPEQAVFLLEASPPTKKTYHFLPKTKVSPVTVSPEKSDPLPDITPIAPIPSPRTMLPRKPETAARTILPQSPPKSCHDVISPAPRTLSPPKLSSWADSKQNTDDLKTKVKITGLSSYQQRFMSYNDELDNTGFKSLEETTSEKISESSITSVSLTKSQSFRSKTVFASSEDHTSLPYTVNSLVSDANSDSETFTDSLMSATTPISDHLETVTVNKDSTSDNEIKIINTNAEIVEHVEKKDDFVEATSSVFISNEKESTIDADNNWKDGVTILTKTSSNQVIVNIDSSEPENRESQVSITKVQLKRESKAAVETTSKQLVPEFLKIQLNKVDAKPSTNIVLSTSNSFGKADEKPKQKSVLEIETDRESGEIITDNIKRKFSTDVEIIDKETDEEIIQVPTKNVPSRSSFPIVINHGNQSNQPRKSSMSAGTGSSPTNKSFLKKKSNSLELDSIKIDDNKLSSNKANSTDQLASKAETTKEKLNSLSDSEKQDSSSPPEVIMRKKSLGSQKSDKDSDEPELMKVFARRSLKLKDSEAETLSQQVMVLVEADKAESAENNKRDSDKENECNESPVEERKKTIFPCNKEASNPKPKEPLCESKFVETADVTLRKPSSTINNKLSVFGGAKYQRAVSLQTSVLPSNDVNDNNTNEEKRRNKSFIEAKITNYRAPNIMKDIEIKTADSNKIKNEDEFKKKEFENEDYVPRFKRIQQRKEEWEKRAQQNMKKSVP